MKKLSEYKIGDRVKYVFLGDYDGTISKVFGKGSPQPWLLIDLDRAAPVEFNTGKHDVLALSPDYIELIKD